MRSVFILSVSVEVSEVTFGRQEKMRMTILQFTNVPFLALGHSTRDVAVPVIGTKMKIGLTNAQSRFTENFLAASAKQVLFRTYLSFHTGLGTR